MIGMKMAKNLQYFFLIWIKPQAIQNQIHLLKTGEKEVKIQSQILLKLYQCYEELLSKYVLILMTLLLRV